jgi:hypothetical protein
LVVTIALLVAAATTTVMVVQTAGGSASPVTPALAVTSLPFRPAPVTLPSELFLSWALMDQRTGQIWGSSTMDTPDWTASMIKAWLAADYLRQKPNPSQATLTMIDTMIRDSDNDAATTIYDEEGQGASIGRLVRLCGLTDSTPGTRWGITDVSARDAVRMGSCIADGVAAGPVWTGWLMDLMRGVRGEGDFGIRDALPAAQAARVAVKNGYEHFGDDGLFHVNCLAVGPGWTMAVMQVYPPANGWGADLQRGANGCADVARQLLTRPEDPG